MVMLDGFGELEDRRGEAAPVRGGPSSRGGAPDPVEPRPAGRGGDRGGPTRGVPRVASGQAQASPRRRAAGGVAHLRGGRLHAGAGAPRRPRERRGGRSGRAATAGEEGGARCISSTPTSS